MSVSCPFRDVFLFDLLSTVLGGYSSLSTTVLKS